MVAWAALSPRASEVSELDPELLGLRLGAGEPLLEVVARAELADEGDLDRPRVERRRDGGRRGGRLARGCGLGGGGGRCRARVALGLAAALAAGGDEQGDGGQAREREPVDAG